MILINTVEEYISVIGKLKANYTYRLTNDIRWSKMNQSISPDFIFRGHADALNYKLLPGIFRSKQIAQGTIITEYSQMEYNILYEFVSEACNYIKNISIDDIPAWLEIAQHFGVPTRLLDFTQNPLVALYFACMDLKNIDGSVWIINTTAYNKLFFGEFGKIPEIKSRAIISKIISDEIIYRDNLTLNDSEHIQHPFIYKPCYREERMNTQSSIFMIWGSKRVELTKIMTSTNFMLDENDITNQSTGVIANIIIPGGKKQDLLRQLDLCGINEKFIYPGLDGIGKFVKRKYSSNL